MNVESIIRASLDDAQSVLTTIATNITNDRIDFNVARLPISQLHSGSWIIDRRPSCIFARTSYA